MRKPTLRFPNKFDTNQAKQAQKMARRIGNFCCRKKRNCTICLAITKALISFAVTVTLICAFAFAYADYWFSHEVAHVEISRVIFLWSLQEREICPILPSLN